MTSPSHIHCLEKQGDLSHFFASWVTEIQREDETKERNVSRSSKETKRKKNVEHIPAGEGLINGTDELSRCSQYCKGACNPRPRKLDNSRTNQGGCIFFLKIIDKL